jgi:hypothetical protein
MIRARPELRLNRRTTSNPSTFGHSETGLNPTSVANQPFLKKASNVKTTNR